MYTRILLPCFAILTLVHSFAILPSSNKKIRAPTRLFSGDTKFQKYDHTLAILTFPRNSNNQIANEAILMQAMDRTMKRLSVVIRCQDGLAHRTPIEDLRRYVGEIYSLVWDCNQSLLRTDELLDVIVYPQSLPNAAPEQWLYHRPSLNCICGADDMLGWYSTGPSNNEYLTKNDQGLGGLASHCAAVNDDRIARGLDPVEALSVELPRGATDLPHMTFLEDSSTSTRRNAAAMMDDEEDRDESMGLLGGSRLDSNLYDSVAVGGTFDGIHYGHRKLLMFAISSVTPNGKGRLMIGVTSDEMLQKKTLAKYIEPASQRVQEVLDFVSNLAPGIKNRIQIKIVLDAFGPPATEDHFTALVLSHETLDNGLALNEIRKQKGMEELALLCTRRTEANAMSSTTLRRMRAEQDHNEKVVNGTGTKCAEVAS
uniref:Cytidyltransferase-like domain-containing protein n=2 Tax=Leptocylindrus danicus TaxID=163516 RepID=A0A7S2K9D5_9STRA|mmetsp:Transcript_19391/g.28888  ORF Transcript_19391/g.28888 Transcript_19391/m.28888 type:complete len:427 (+) Transcript_19391:48-1328(+)